MRRSAPDKVYVIGHKNPDCDSIVSAIAYAEIKNALAGWESAHAWANPSSPSAPHAPMSQESNLAATPPENRPYRYVAARSGPVNHETATVLASFGFQPPQFLPNIRPQVSDVRFDRPMRVPKGSPLKEVWKGMLETKTATACIVDPVGKLCGLTTLGDIARAELYAPAKKDRYSFPMANLVRVLGAEVLSKGQPEFDGRVFVGDIGIAWAVKAMSACDMLVVSDRPDLQRAAVEKGIAALVVTDAGRAPVSSDLVELARARGTYVLKVAVDTHCCLGLLWQAVPVDQVMTRCDVATFSLDDLVLEVREEMRMRPFKLYPVMDEHGRPTGMIGRNHLADPPRKRVIMVDHNEKTQSVEGIDTAEVLEVVDHHRIGSIETDHPILFLNRPWGSTATIVSALARQNGVTLSPALSGLLAAAIISDTLAFKSPTSTSQDRLEAERLASRAGIDLVDLADSVLEAKTYIEDTNPEEILRSDFKEFTVGKSKLGIGQATTLGGFSSDLKRQLLAATRNLMEDAGYDLVALMLTDVAADGSEVLWAAHDGSLAERAFGYAGVEAGAQVFWLPGVVSRKQQFAPEIMRAVRELERS
jgi:manganese-dependent inorganic pyrophosphatase